MFDKKLFPHFLLENQQIFCSDILFKSYLGDVKLMNKVNHARKRDYFT